MNEKNRIDLIRNEIYAEKESLGKSILSGIVFLAVMGLSIIVLYIVADYFVQITK